MIVFSLKMVKLFLYGNQYEINEQSKEIEYETQTFDNPFYIDPVDVVAWTEWEETDEVEYFNHEGYTVAKGNPYFIGDTWANDDEWTEWDYTPAPEDQEFTSRIRTRSIYQNLMTPGSNGLWTRECTLDVKGFEDDPVDVCVTNNGDSALPGDIETEWRLITEAKLEPGIVDLEVQFEESAPNPDFCSRCSRYCCLVPLG